MLNNSLTKKISVKDILLDILFCVTGCFMYAICVNTFTVPNKIAPGGFTGLSTIINYLFDLPIGLVYFLLNIPVLIIAWKLLGFKLIVKSIMTAVIFSIIVDISPDFLPVYTNDRLLAALFGGVFSGLAGALVFLRGATFAGTDILAKLLRLKWPHITMGQIIMINDMIVVCISGIVFHSLESALYAIIVIFISSKVIDYILYGTGHGKMALVFTNQPDLISKAILNELHRGVSIVDVKGAYTGEQKYMLICAVRGNELPKLTKIIKHYDEQPFLLVSEVGEIIGQGFKIKDSDL